MDSTRFVLVSLVKEHEVHKVIQAPVGHLLGYVEMMFHSSDLKEQGFFSAEV